MVVLAGLEIVTTVLFTDCADATAWEDVLETNTFWPREVVTLRGELVCFPWLSLLRCLLSSRRAKLQSAAALEERRHPLSPLPPAVLCRAIAQYLAMECRGLIAQG